MPLEFAIPEFSLVMLVGPSGVGKSTLAARHFASHEILSPREFARILGAPEPDADAWELLDLALGKRLAAGRLTVIDATNLYPQSRSRLTRIARKYHCPVSYLIWDLPWELLSQRSDFDPAQLRMHHDLTSKVEFDLQTTGASRIQVLRSATDEEELRIIRVPNPANQKHLTGPFDLIGDVHGCLPELLQLLAQLGYQVSGSPAKGFELQGNPARTLLFVGDLVDRGPDSPGVLRLVMDLVHSGRALCVLGNHDDKLRRYLQGNEVQLNHGLDVTVDQLNRYPEAFRREVAAFIEGLPLHLVLDQGRLTVAHAGIKEAMQGRQSSEIRAFCLYGETTGENDEFGLPVRYNWAADYEGESLVVYGHTPVPDAEWLNQTIDIDTGCVFGGKLTALRYPEKELLAVQSHREYATPRRPMGLSVPPPKETDRFDSLLPLSDYAGRNLVLTRLKYNITLREQVAAPTLAHLITEGIDPRWLVYLPPHWSPPKAARLGTFLEHPHEAFVYYERKGIEQVIVQEQPFGERVVLLMCRTPKVAKRVFGVERGATGVVYDQTARPVFASQKESNLFFRRLNKAMEEADLWEETGGDWLLLEGIAQGLDRSDARNDLWQRQAKSAHLHLELEQQWTGSEASAEQLALLEVKKSSLAHFEQALSIRESAVQQEKFTFHLTSVVCQQGRLAWTSAPESQREWTLRLAELVPEFHLAAYRRINLSSDQERLAAVREWEAGAGRGQEGILVYPPSRLVEQGSDIVQAGMKVRNPAALSLLFGPHMLLPEQLELNRMRSLKEIRQRCTREFALAYESLCLFLEEAPLSQVYQVCATQLSLAHSEQDPRL